MILHAPILALVVGSILIGFLLLLACGQAVGILRHWNLASGSERQLLLERRTYLVSTVMSYACAFQVVSLFLFIYTADDLAPLFVGAMCAAGTLAVNGYGYPTLLAKVASAVLAGAWLVVNHADTQGRDYPLIRPKYVGLLLLAPVMLLEMGLQAAYFGGLRADVITSCCGSLFSTTGSGVSAELARLPAVPTTVVFYGVVAALAAATLWFVRRDSGGYLVAGASLAAFGVSIAALIAVISPYIYELPTHRCPFCILQAGYHYIGYPIYGLLLTGTIAGLGVGLLHPWRKRPSLAAAAPPLQRRLALTAMACFAAFALLAAYVMLATSFRLEG
jgi:hypothetical protein